MMSDTTYDQLVEVSGTIARHLDYPGKRDAIRLCREDIRERSLRGSLSPEQAERLTTILSGADRHDTRR